MEVFETIDQLNETSKYVKKLLQFEGNQVVNIQLKAGETIPRHHAKENVLIVVRKGKVVFKVGVEKVELTNHQLLYMEPFEDHDLEAVEDVDLLVIKISQSN